MESVIDFHPRENDIVSTKLRTWNLKHPGNLYYSEVVHRMVKELKSDDPVKLKEVGEAIVNHLVGERGGRFLKLKDGELHSTTCTVLEFRPAVAKVIHALKTAISRRGSKNSHSSEVKRKRPEVKGKSSSHPTGSLENNKKSPGFRNRSTRRSSADGQDPLVYNVQEGPNQPLPKYLLDIINAICNESDPESAFRVLDNPVGSFTMESEPDLERARRLQLRQRFAGAASVGMSPLHLVSKLLSLWGAKLTTVKREPPLESTTPSEQPETSTLVPSVKISVSEATELTLNPMPTESNSQSVPEGEPPVSSALAAHHSSVRSLEAEPIKSETPVEVAPVALAENAKTNERSEPTPPSVTIPPRIKI
eukprot:Nitzschia sp. Nitz4//scaffold58_size112336//95945//97036//NITZ4_004048-RA/size112336-processed-gene-0.200-mRNA-1//1//CDS//3329555034//4111//frame0